MRCLIDKWLTVIKVQNRRIGKCMRQAVSTNLLRILSSARKHNRVKVITTNITVICQL